MPMKLSNLKILFKLYVKIGSTDRNLKLKCSGTLFEKVTIMAVNTLTGRQSQSTRYNW